MIVTDRKCDVCRDVIRPGARFFVVKGSVMSMVDDTTNDPMKQKLDAFDDQWNDVAPAAEEVCSTDCAVKWFYKKMRS